MATGQFESESAALNEDNSAGEFAWYCVRTKPKHEHIASASVRRNLGFEVFHPRLQMERCRRGTMVKIMEPLFAGYIFVRCSSASQLEDIRYSNGVSSVVRFGDRAASVPEEVIQELRRHFEAEIPVVAEDRLRPGVGVVVAGGAFEGMAASVLRVLPVRQRVELLMEILGRPTTVEVDRRWVALEHDSVLDLVPFLAAA